MGRRDLTGEPNERRNEIREADRYYAIHQALGELSRLGPTGSRRRWWAFEGFTSVDFYIQTADLRIYVEGKRTETLTLSTDWYPRRSQLLRISRVRKPTRTARLSPVSSSLRNR